MTYPAGNEYEYSIDPEKKIWQDSPEFLNLAPDTPYTVSVRTRETSVSLSGAVLSRTIRTRKTSSGVYLVKQGVDEGWDEKDAVYIGRYTGSVPLPREEGFTAYAYSRDRYETETERSLLYTTSFLGIEVFTLPAGASSIYLYYYRNQYPVNYHIVSPEINKSGTVYVPYGDGLAAFKEAVAKKDPDSGKDIAETLFDAGYYLAGWTAGQGTDSVFDYHAALEGDPAYCLIDLDSMKMPADSISLNAVLVKHRIQVRLSTNGYDEKGTRTNYNGWQEGLDIQEIYRHNPDNLRTPVQLKPSQQRCFYTEQGESIPMNGGMSTATRTAYTLDGWFTQNNNIRWKEAWACSSKYFDSTQRTPFVINGKTVFYYYNMTLIAKWKLSPAVVLYSVVHDDGTEEIIDRTAVKPGGRITVTAAVPVYHPENQAFYGWQGQSLLNTRALYQTGDVFSYSSLNEVTGYGENGSENTIRLTAVYHQEAKGTLIFDTRGGSYIPPLSKENQPDSYVVTEGDIEQHKADKPVRTGYDFVGWYHDEACMLPVNWGAAAPVTVSGDNNTTIYAGWVPKKFDISFKNLGDGGQYMKKDIPCGSSVVVSDEEIVDNLIRDHYVFDGWSPELPSLMPPENLEVSAVWIPVQYSILFDTDGGSAVEPIIGEFGVRVYAPKAPAKEGYAFSGWFPAFTLTTMPDSNPVYKAVWKPVQEAPDRPEIQSVTGTAIQVAAIEGEEYSIDGGRTWDAAGLFDGLKPGTAYEITARKAATDKQAASPASPARKAVTKKKAQETPAAPEVVRALNSLEVSPVTDGLEYAIADAEDEKAPEIWIRPDEDGHVIFNGLPEDTEYRIYARRPETETAEASAPSEAAHAWTRKTMLLSVEIQGIAVAGTVLQAVIDSPDAQDVQYQWTRDGEDIVGAAVPVYRLTAEDIGHEIQIFTYQPVRSTRIDNFASNTLDGLVQKADGGPAPAVKAEADETTIHVLQPEQTEGQKYEYSLDGSFWQTDDTFSGLYPAMIYTVYAREKETDVTKAGDTGKVKVTTNHTLAEVFEVYQKADGTFEEPLKARPSKADSLYMVPEDPDHFTASGYRYDSFSSDIFQTQETAAGERIVFPAGVSRLYIYYERDSYELTLYSDIAGTSVLDSWEVFYEGSLALAGTCSVLRDDYSFAGWSETPRTDGTEYSWHAGTPGYPDYVVCDPASMRMPGRDKSLYPVLIPYSLEVHLDVGAIDENANDTIMNGWTNPVEYTDEATPASMTEEQWRCFTIHSGDLIRMDEGMNAVTRPGYRLEGWYTGDGVRWTADRRTAPEFCDKDDEGNPILTTGSKPYSYYMMTLTAKWTPVAVTVNYGGTAPDDKVMLGGTVTLPSSVNVTSGQRLAAWKDRKGGCHAPGQIFAFTDFSLTQNDMLLFTPEYETVPTYGVVFDTDGGSYVPTQTVEEGSYVDRPETPTKAGFSFEDWVYADDPEETVVFPITGIKKTYYVKAVWSRRAYTIWFDPNGGSRIKPLMVMYQDPVEAEEPTRGNYTFAGWIPALPKTMQAQDLYEEASWNPVTYTISFDSAGGSEVPAVSGVYGSKVKMPADPVREGYAFVGWDPSVPVYMPDKNLKVTAVWKQKQDKPDAPVVTGTTATTIRVQDAEGQEFAITETQKSGEDRAEIWQKSTLFEHLSPAKKYRIVTRRAATNTSMASEVSDPAEAVTLKQDQAAPNPPSVNASYTSVSVRPAISGQEYSIDAGKTWQKPDEHGVMLFSGLTPDTRYEIAARWTETDTQYVSPASSATVIYTLKNELKSVRIEGKAVYEKYHQELTARIWSENAEDVSYQWYRDTEAIPGATVKIYQMIPLDLNRTLSVVATQTRNSGAPVSVKDTVGPVEPGEGAAAPSVAAEAGVTTITVKEPANDYLAYEYSLDKTSWQVITTFTGLTPATEYTVYARERYSGIQKAGQIGETKVTTEGVSAAVYEVRQDVNGRWTEPQGPLETPAQNVYTIPADTDEYKAASYSINEYLPTENGRTGTHRGAKITLDAGTQKLYVYYERRQYDLVFYEDTSGRHESSRYTLYYGASLTPYRKEQVSAAGMSFEGWTTEPDYSGSFEFRTREEYEAARYDLKDKSMPAAGLPLYPILVRYRLEVRLDVGAFDEKANDQNMGGWVNPVVYPSDVSPAVMNEEQPRRFWLPAGSAIDMGILQAVTREGYEQDGWVSRNGMLWTEGMRAYPQYLDVNDDGSLTVSAHPGEPYSANVLTLTAKWKPKTIPVDYDGEGPVDVTASLESTFTLPDSGKSSTDSNRLACWKDKNGVRHAPGEIFTFNDWSLTTDGRLVFTAEYEPVGSCGVVFDSKGGSFIPAIYVDSGRTVEGPDHNPARTGCLFEGWVRKGTTVKVTFPLSNVRELIHVEAVWRQRFCTITFHTNGGTPIAPVTLQAGSKVAVTDPVREGYDFQRWIPEMPDDMPEHNVSLYAVWSPHGYNLTFDRQNGSDPDVSTVSYGAKITVPEDPVRDGYIFAGWTPEIPDYMPGRNLTIRAVWKQTQPPPEAPVLKNRTETSLELEPGDGEEYLLRDMIGSRWKRPDENGRVVFEGLQPDTQYTILARKAAAEDKVPSDPSEPASFYTAKKLLTGAAIRGVSMYGQTLIAGIEPADAQDVQFRWYRDGEMIAGAESSSYEIVEADIGKVLRAEVTQTVYGGDDVTVSGETEKVDKLPSPAAPEVTAQATANTVTVNGPAQEGERFEYSLDGEAWQTVPVFRNVPSGGLYNVYAREKETSIRNAGRFGDTVVETPSTYAKIYEVCQAADGSWSEPSAPGSEEAADLYTVPLNSEQYRAVSYSFDAFLPDETGRTKTAEGEKITIPEGKAALYIYYARQAYKLTFYSDITGTEEKVSYEVPYGSSLGKYAAETASQDGCTFAGWSETYRRGGEYTYEYAMPGSKYYCVADLPSLTMPAGDKGLYPVFVPYRVLVLLDVGAVDLYANETNMNGWKNPVVYTDTSAPALMKASQWRAFYVDAGELIRMDSGMNSISRAGYSKEGWFTQDGVQWMAGWETGPEYCDKDASGKAVLKEHDSKAFMYYTMTLTARWTPVPIVTPTPEPTGTPAVPTGTPAPEPTETPATGVFWTEIREDAGVPLVTSPNLNEEFVKSMLTEEDRERLALGKDIGIYMKVTNNHDFIPEAEKALVEKVLKEWSSEAETAWYLDFSVFKKRSSEEPIRLTELDGQLLKLIMTIPEKFMKDGRLFCIVRVHDGKAEILAEGSGGAIPFESGRFSTYVLAYTDEERPPEVTPTATPTPEPTATPTPEPTATATPEPTATPTPEPTVTETPEPTATPTPEPTATLTPEPTATPTPEPTVTETPEPTSTPTPEPTDTPEPEPTVTETPEPEPTETPIPEPTDTPTPGPTAPASSPTPTIGPGGGTSSGGYYGGGYYSGGYYDGADTHDEPQKTTPGTGDATDIFLWMLLLAGAMLTAILTSIRRRRI